MAKRKASPAGYKKIGGGSIRAKKMLSCEICNFMELYSAKSKLKTGSKCPRCSNKTLRVFDSKAEFKRAQELKLLSEAGDITDLTYQPRFPLHAVPLSSPVTISTPDATPCASSPTPTHLYDYVSDFSYHQNGEYVVEDVKGGSRGKPIITDVAAMKMKHFEIEYGVPVRITIR